MSRKGPELWNKLMSRKGPDTVRNLGYFAIIFSGAFLFMFAMNIRAHIYYDSPLIFKGLGWIGLYFLVTGLGLTQMKKWALILLFAIALVGVFFIVVAVRSGADLLVLLGNLAFCLVMIGIPVRMLRYWKELSW
jgi:hypothetical protein